MAKNPASKNAAPAPAVAADKATHLRVRALVAGFRRAGRAWSDEDTDVPIADFTAEQVGQLIGEPQLVVKPFIVEQPKEGDK